jgi:hypothetical protein
VGRDDFTAHLFPNCDPQRTNRLLMQMAISPDGRYVAVVNAGYGTS